jgi:hypothetical protein
MLQDIPRKRLVSNIRIYFQKYILAQLSSEIILPRSGYKYALVAMNAEHFASPSRTAATEVHPRKNGEKNTVKFVVQI